MSEWQAFFDMGGYAVYVWPAYAVSIMTLVGLALLSWRDMKRSERLVDLNEKTSRAAR